ncbi:MAG TPA: GWxTD domain-containing protein [Pyrinomonadaceae bacterium]|jgi:GWxTD domain-containing protein|nr:GWxTD domain-containing protein [Pyrinomonadaceae bacterium]
MTVSTFRRLTALALISVLSLFTIQAQQVKPNPDEKPRKVKEELKTAYKNWINDVDPILTQSERDAWTKLRSDEEREQFIRVVWDSRDPDPDTEENEFKEQFYERVAYANEHFSSGKPGRMTDRGRIYIKFGKPDEIESHPAGGPYERPSYEGGGSTSTYPFEKWFYRHLPNVANGVELEFVDPTGSGEYRLARNPDEKDALIHIPGAGPTIDELYGFGNRADRIAGLNGFGLANYRRAQDSPFEVLNLMVAMEREQPGERHLFGRTTTPIVDDNSLNFSAQDNYFRQSDNQVLAALTIQADNSELSFKDIGGIQTARLNITGSITTIAERRVGKFEDSVLTTATAEELSSTRMRKSAYAKTFIIAPGHYRLDLFVRDVESGAAGVQHIGFQAPTFSTDKLAASSIVLAAKLEDLSLRPAGGPFVIGTKKVVPNISGVYRTGEPVGIYLQVYNSAIDQTLLRPAVDVDYVLLRDGKEINKQSEDWREINDSGQRLTLTRLIDTRALAAGEYQIQVRIHDRITGQTITPNTTFTVGP